MKRLTRRSLLATTGASALLLPLLEQSSLGATPAYPKRVIFIVTGNGTIENSFWPTGSDGNLTLGEIVEAAERRAASGESMSRARVRVPL